MQYRVFIMAYVFCCSEMALKTGLDASIESTQECPAIRESAGEVNGRKEVLVSSLHLRYLPVAVVFSSHCRLQAVDTLPSFDKYVKVLAAVSCESGESVNQH
jgi:hypothetical protein